MSWFTNLKIKTRIIVSFALVVTLMVMISVFAVTQLTSVNEVNDHIMYYTRDRAVTMLQLQNNISNYRRLIVSMAMYAPLNDSVMVEQLAHQAFDEYNRILEEVERYTHYVNADPYLTQWDRQTHLESVNYIREAMLQYKTNVNDIVANAALIGDYNRAVEAIITGTPITARMMEVVYELIYYAEDTMESEIYTLANTTDQSIIIIVMLTVLSAVTTLIIALYLEKSIISKT